MTHDPLCGCTPKGCKDCALCECQLITRVREDERAAALRDAVGAVLGCVDYKDGDNMLLVDAYRFGLESAREAIEALGGER